MGLFDFMKVCLFSEMKGVVTQDGKPVAGAEIVRTAEFNDKTFSDKTITNEHGEFRFGELSTNSINKMFVVIEAVIAQKFVIRFDNKDYIGWQTVKRDYDSNTELGGNKNIDLACELTSEKTKKEKNLRVPIVGICTWKNN